MRTIKITLTLVVIAVGFSAGVATAAGKPTTIQGTLGTTANGSSSFITSVDKEYYFDPISKEGKKIWKICERDQICVVTGVIKKDMIMSVSSVKKGK